jgi:CheY-like chemotaxis protein
MERSRQTVADKNLDEGLKLLIIDDEPNHAEVVAESLERVGYQCVVATSGTAGAKIIEQDEPEVILTDLKMDGVDGFAKSCPIARLSLSPVTATCKPPWKP